MKAEILIVDDEENLVYFLREALRLEFPDCGIQVAGSGEEGLSRLAEHHYDLIIADYRMPGFSGLELIHGVRYLDPHTAIILMTGFGSDELRGQAEELAIDRYFPKPFELDEMLAAVTELLSGRSEA